MSLCSGKSIQRCIQNAGRRKNIYGAPHITYGLSYIVHRSSYVWRFDVMLHPIVSVQIVGKIWLGADAPTLTADFLIESPEICGRGVVVVESGQFITIKVVPYQWPPLY